MENSKECGAGEKPAEANPGPSPNPSAENPDESAAIEVASAAEAEAPSRRPFTALSQVDADLALARVLQEQERAYMMLHMGGDLEGSEYSSEGGSYDDYEDDDDDPEDEVPDDQVQQGEEQNSVQPDPDRPIEEEEGMEGSDYGDDVLEEDEEEEDLGEFEDDEAFARALQDAEEREVAVRLMALAGLSEWRAVEHEENANTSQDAWQELDPDEYSYEELVALGEVVGTETRGASADTISSLPCVKYKAQISQEENAEQCVVCRVEFEEDESLVMLPCKHMYHNECISKWLEINKACPMCSTEVSTSNT